ncbi:hypothetical protein DE146DRAFT_770032 [Phaeosphaeria sp. MPI-PUGE-AT-0046c]|nr:hypothetical protein DE146DRAFT_770032 [Phaeosphaeria sp. MPI-PUGE-AT-0046c]
MPASWRRGGEDRVKSVVVERDGVDGGREAVEIRIEPPTRTANRIFRRSHAKRQAPTPTDIQLESDDDSDYEDDFSSATPTKRPFTLTSSVPTRTPATISMGERQGGISQGTEHLLIAAGSIGATIVLVMIVLGLYTMRKRGLTFSDVLRRSQDSFRGRSAPPLPPKNNSTGKSFVLANAPARQNSHRRDISATPSSPLLPIQNTRRSDSTHDTRSLRDEEEALDYVDPPRQGSALPAPPTFRQFLSNRPSISQRPGLGGAMASRFSWTNSNAPQTPHDPSRDTVNAASALGRDSFITTRSSVPRFRTINSWVNQQSTRVEEQRLKQQFRMTQSTTYSDDGDNVPEMPPVPKCPDAKDVKSTKHQRHDTVDTAPIFKAHPGTEVRFSTRSTVPSEVLDMGRRNAAL